MIIWFVCAVIRRKLCRSFQLKFHGCSVSGQVVCLQYRFCYFSQVILCARLGLIMEKGDVIVRKGRS